MPLLETTYKAPKFFKNALLQSLYSIYLRKLPPLAYTREKVVTPDLDFLYLDWIHKDPRRLVILTHGITGDSQTSYTRGMAKAFAQENWSVLAWNMRGRGAHKGNWRHRNYHLGYTDDLRFILDHVVKQTHYNEIILIGFSMGANIVLKYIGEEGKSIHPSIKGSIAFSAPIEIVSCGEKIDLPSQRFYSMHLLRKSIRNAVSKFSITSPFIDIERLLKVKTWKEFDEIYTAPVFGFNSVEEYRQTASSMPLIPNISVPSLLINAKDDPLLSKECYPQDDLIKMHPHFFVEFPENGGHLGFVCFKERGMLWSERRSLEFAEYASSRAKSRDLLQDSSD